MSWVVGILLASAIAVQLISALGQEAALAVDDRAEGERGSQCGHPHGPIDGLGAHEIGDGQGAQAFE
ncbi:MAG TPA: hypothetical protein VNN79_00255, partial [Actinomycetota bacterium]|nr:hypothetical protein [Actinomycetota bacterium]